MRLLFRLNVIESANYHPNCLDARPRDYVPRGVYRAENPIRCNRIGPPAVATELPPLAQGVARASGIMKKKSRWT